MKKFAQIGLVMAIVFMSSVALVACGGKGDIANGTYVMTSYTVDGTAKTLAENKLTSTDQTIIDAGYISEIVIDGKKFSNKEIKGTAAAATKVSEKEYTVGEDKKVTGTDIPTGYTYENDKITYTSGTTVIVYEIKK